MHKIQWDINSFDLKRKSKSISKTFKETASTSGGNFHTEINNTFQKDKIDNKTANKFNYDKLFNNNINDNHANNVSSANK